MDLRVSALGRKHMLQTIMDNIINSGDCQVRLYTNDLSGLQEYSDSLGSFFEASFGGYAPITLDGFVAPFTDGDNKAHTYTSTFTFVRTGGSTNLIRGYFVSWDPGGGEELLMWEPFEEEIELNVVGQPLSFNIHFTLTEPPNA